MTAIRRAGLILAVCAPLCAGAPFRAAEVPADAAWVVHADLDALRDTDVGVYLLDRFLEEQAASQLAAFTRAFGMDPRSDLRSVTLHGFDGGGAPGVVVLRGRYEPARAAAHVSTHTAHEIFLHGNHAVHAWVDDRERMNAERGERPPVPLLACFVSETTAVLGRDRARVAQALDVLDARVPSAAGAASFAPLGPAAAGAFLVGGGRLAKPRAGDLRSTLLRHAEEVHLAVGESGGDVRAAVVFRAGTDAEAELVRRVIDGFAALTLLESDGRPDVARAAESLRIARDGSRVRLDLACPAAAAVDLLRGGAGGAGSAP